MKQFITFALLAVICTSCATYSLQREDPETRYLYPSTQEFTIKAGGNSQAGVDKYLIVGNMEVEGLNYTVIRLPYGSKGMLFYGLIDSEGNLHSRFFSPIKDEVPLMEARFIRVPAHRIRTIPSGVRFLPL